MSIHIIIDGYNLIRQSSTLSALDQQDIMLGRDALIDMLAAYRKMKPHRITVVFDGSNSPLFSPQRNRQRGISMRFSRSGECQFGSGSCRFCSIVWCSNNQCPGIRSKNRNGRTPRQLHQRRKRLCGLDSHHKKTGPGSQVA
ncbi:MAG: NYN domain-containing protein [Deltaproteobacteria bacterium]